MTPMLRGDAFSKLAAEHADAVYRTARRIAKSDADAADVVSEVFLAVLKRPDTYLSRDDVAKSLRWLAVKKALESLRKSRHRSDRELAAFSIANASEPSVESDVMDQVEAREARGALLESLARLPEELRVAIVLRFQEGLSLREAATALAVSDVAVHDRVQRGIERLRAMLKAAGFSALALSIESELRAAPAPSVPAGLAASVAKIPLGITAIPVAGMLAAGCALAVAVGLGVYEGVDWLRTPQNPAKPERAVATNSSALAVRTSPPQDPVSNAKREAIPDASSALASASAADDPFAAMKHAVIAGRVSLAADDSPLLPHILVIANSRRHQDKADTPKWHIPVRADGTYELEVPVEDDGAYFKLWIEYEDSVLAWGPEIRVMPQKRFENQDMKFEKPLGEKNGDFELSVTLRDRTGALVANEWVQLDRIFDYVGDDPRAAIESRARTDLAGRAHFQGKHLGRKRLEIVTDLTLLPIARVDLTIDANGSYEREFTFKDLELSMLHSAPPRADAVANDLYIEGTVFDETTNAPLLAIYHRTRVCAIGKDVTEEQLRSDVIQNAVFDDPPVQIEIDGDPQETDKYRDVVAAPGSYLIVLTAAERAPAIAGPFDLKPGTPIKDVKLTLRAPSRIHGRVLDAKGHGIANAHLIVTGVGPISDARIKVCDDDVRKADGANSVWSTNGRTNSDGSFELNELPAGQPLRIVALHPRFEPAASGFVALAPKEVKDGFDLTLVTAREP